MGDGGLRQAQAELTAKADAVARQREADDRRTDSALRDQASRLDAAIAAFLVAASDKGIGAEQFVVGSRGTGPKPRSRFGRDERGKWGIHARSAPTELIYAGGYILHRWVEKGDGYRQQELRVMESGRVELHNIDVRRQTIVWDARDEPLPFYRGYGETLEAGTLHGDVARRIGAIEETTNWFVRQLAAYLLAHREL